jgi:hypothetical protein
MTLAPTAPSMAAARAANVATKTLEMTGGSAFTKTLLAIGDKLGHGGELSVGFLEKATYPGDPDDPEKAGLKVAQVAFWNEFGTSRAPPRPFFRNMIAEKAKTWGRALGLNAKNNKYDAKGTLTAMGHGIRDQLVESIVKFRDPPNAPYTIRKKGFDKPLIDTGVMQRSVDFEVKVK